MPAEKPAQKAPEQEVVVEAFELTIEEWCAHRSATDNRPELLGAFYASERRAGNVKDSSEAFADRFTTFANAPA